MGRGEGCGEECGGGVREGREGAVRGGVRVGGRALPRAVLGEVALDPLGAEGVRGDVDGDAEVVARECDLLNAAGVELVQPVRPRKMK